MASTQNPPAGSHGNEAASTKPKVDAPLSQDEPTSGPAGSSYKTYEAKKEGQPAPPPSSSTPPVPMQTPSQPLGQSAPGTADQRINDIISSGFEAREASRPGRDAHDVADTAKDLGSKALHGIKTLSTGQIALGVGVLAAGIAFFITKGKSKYPKVRDQRGGRHQTKGHPTGHQPHTPRGNDMVRRGERPWGNSRFAGPADGGRGRVQAGSGYDDRRSQGKGPRRDQGPGNGRGYDPRTSGRQNPNNVDQLGSAY